MILKIEIQEAQENVLIYEKSTHRGVLLHGLYPEPKSWGVVHTAAGQERSVSSREEESIRENGTCRSLESKKKWASLGNRVILVTFDQLSLITY